MDRPAGHFHQRAVERFQIRRVMSCLLVPAPANHIDRAVDRDPVQPRAEVRARLEAAQLPVRLEECLLDHVLGVLGIAGHPMGQPVDRPAVAIDQASEGLAVAAAGEGDGGGIRLRHPSD